MHLVKGRLSNKAAVSLTWTVNEIAAQHRVEIQKGSGAWTLAAITAAQVATVTITGLDLSTAYNFRIRSEDGGGASSYVTGVSVTTGALATTGSPPTAPTSLAISDITGYSATATWEDASNNEAYFEIQVRRGVEVKSYFVEGLVESLSLPLDSAFADAPNSIFTARVRAIGGKGTARAKPTIGSDWSAEVTFETGSPAVAITSAASVVAEQGQPFEYVITTNITATGWTADSNPGSAGQQLPAGLSRTDGTISGTVTAATGFYTIAITATDGTTTGSLTLRLQVIPPSLRITSASTANAVLAAPFTFTLRAVRLGNAPLTWSLVNAPAWLSVDDETGVLTGTPTDEGVYGVTTVVTDGTRTVSALLTITVPGLSITSDDTLDVFAGEAYVHTLVATSPAVVWALEDGAPAWVTLAGNRLTILAPAPGSTDFDVTATIGEDLGASQTITVTAAPLIDVPTTITGEVGAPLAVPVTYAGTGQAYNWDLGNAPAGVQLTAAAFTDNIDFRRFDGKPTVEGRFVSTLVVSYVRAGVSAATSIQVTFLISGDLYIPWLHADRTLYDLQWQVRGPVPTRAVRSYFGLPAEAGTPVDVVTQETSGDKKTTTTQSGLRLGGRAPRVLVVKRGDEVRLALVPRDGREVLDTADGIADVKLAMRLADSADTDFLFDVSATPTTVDDHEYFLVELDVTSDLLTDLLGDDGILSEPISVVAEIRCTLDGHPLSSDSFLIQIAEDVAD